MTVKPTQLSDKLWMIDLMENGRPYRTAAYLIVDEKVTLVETGSATSHEALIHGLREVGVRPADLDYIIVTHVHLDHAGGAGQLMERAKKATLVVHPKGARHMVDPTRLWLGASEVYGDKVTELFGSVVPVSADKILVREHNETLSIGERTLTFFDSPGHAKHHFTILDPVARALYAGDALGIVYRKEFTGWDFEWVMPSTSPVDFDPDVLRRTALFLQQQPFDTVYHAHFGPSPKSHACEEAILYGDVLAKWILAHPDPALPTPLLARELLDLTLSELAKRGFAPGPSTESLSLDMFLDAMGLVVYRQRIEATPSNER